MQPTQQPTITQDAPLLVLGANGFIGSNLVAYLLQQGHKIRAFDRFIQDHHARANDEFYQYVQGDFLNRDDLERAMQGCQVVYHLVSMTTPAESNQNPLFDVEHNVAGTVNFLNACVSSGIRKVVFISSGGTVYGVSNQESITEEHPTDPICAYGIGKLAIEKYLSLYRHIHGLDYTILRVANPYGNQVFNQKQGIIPAFIQCLEQEKPFEIWGDGTVIRDYIHIDDVVKALSLVQKSSLEHSVFNIGSGVGHSINDIIALFESILAKEIPVNFVDARAADVPVNILDIKRADAYLGWQASISLRQGLERLLQTYQLL